MVSKVIQKESKIKRVETNIKIKKAPTKSELVMQVKSLQNTNDALEESIKKKIELIESFSGRIENLEAQIDYLSCTETVLCQETQTEPCLQKENLRRHIQSKPKQKQIFFLNVKNVISKDLQKMN